VTWRWTLYRLVVSAFLIFHLSATIVWVMPTCPLRLFAAPRFAFYVLPLGLWQQWGMFAPDPVRDTCTLEAEAIDAKGNRHRFLFPRLADYSKLGGIPRFRYSKYTANMISEEFVTPRKFAMRHAVRQMKLPADAFPVNIHLYYVVRPAPPIGRLPDPKEPPKTQVLGTDYYESIAEVGP